MNQGEKRARRLFAATPRDRYAPMPEGYTEFRFRRYSTGKRVSGVMRQLTTVEDLRAFNLHPMDLCFKDRRRIFALAGPEARQVWQELGEPPFATTRKHGRKLDARTGVLADHKQNEESVGRDDTPAHDGAAYVAYFCKTASGDVYILVAGERSFGC